MPESKDSELPREERLFARVPRATNDKIAYLVQRWSRGQTLSAADVIIRVVEQAYLEAKEAQTMRVPTEKKRLQQIKAGKADHGILPVPPDESIGVGDILTFREADFDPHQIPTLVPHGDSVSMRITKAEDTGEKYNGCRLYAFRWQPIGADRQATEDLYSEFEREMWRLYEETNTRCGYNASVYRGMLQQHGALETARRLAGDPKPHKGLTLLHKFKALDLSVEALVLREPWRQFFDDDVRSAARAKLRALGYNEPGLGLEAQSDTMRADQV
jgi:hypothetical protein